MSHDHGSVAGRSPVVFKYVEDSYPTDGEINFTVVCENELGPDDYIALHTIGSYDEDSPIFKLTYRELRVHPDSHVAAAVIPVSSFATSLPDDGFYQLCYYSNKKLIDASTPIQIRRARAEDLLEVPAPESPEEDEFVVIKSDKALLQDRINVLTRSNEELEGETFDLKNYVRKLAKDLDEMTSIKVNQDAIISELDEKNEALNQAVSSINLELRGRVKELETMSASLEKYRALSREKADEFNEISKCKNLIQQEHQERVLQIEEMERQKEHLSATLKQTRDHLAAQSQLIHDGLSVQGEMKKEIQDLTRKNVELSDQLRLSQAQVEKLEIASKFVEIRFEDSQRQVDQLTKQNRKLLLDLAQATENLSKAEGRHDKLKARVSAYFEKKKAKSSGIISQAAADHFTTPKAIEASQVTNGAAAAEATENSAPIQLPCAECGEEITCVSDLQAMARHMETRHNIRLCPICSQTFDGSLSTTESELEKHVEEHLEALDN